MPAPPRSTLFPYTTLFRSGLVLHHRAADAGEAHRERAAKAAAFVGTFQGHVFQDRKSTRLNSSHTVISYAVFCLKKKISQETVTVSLASRVVPRLPTSSAT